MGGTEVEHMDSQINGHVCHDRWARKGGPTWVWAAGKKGSKEFRYAECGLTKEATIAAE